MSSFTRSHSLKCRLVFSMRCFCVISQTLPSVLHGLSNVASRVVVAAVGNRFMVDRLVPVFFSGHTTEEIVVFPVPQIRG